MKRIILGVSIVTLFAGNVLAQSSAVTNAIFYHKDKELDKAKEAIDKAVVNAKTSVKAKTWYYKGLIYEDISKSEKFKVLDPKAAVASYEAYNKSIELDAGKKGEYYKYSNDRLKGMWSMMLNGGVKEYNAKNYDPALEMFDIAIGIKPADTTAYLYAAYAAEEKEDFPLAKNYYNNLKKNGSKNPDMYYALAYIAKTVDKDTEAAMKIIAEGRKANPSNKALMEEEIKMFIETGKQDEAIANLEAAAIKDPKNTMYLLSLAQLYTDLKNETKAEESYKKAIAVDPSNADANYNLAANYYNKGADILKIVNELDFNEYQKSGKKKEAEAKEYFGKAIPYFENVLKSTPNDGATLQSLITCYNKTGDKVKMEETMNKMDALGK